MKKAERILENTTRVDELSDIVNILIGRLSRLEAEVSDLKEQLNNKS